MPRATVICLLLLLLPLVSVDAEDGMEGPVAAPKHLEMSRATVLASPGVPKGLRTFLPGGKAPAKLAWPLPKGSVLVLGLPGSDPVARRVCDVYQLDTDDLAGGYKIWAWRADRRSMVIVMGADAAALQSARFEFDASAPSEMTMPGMRSLDFKRPNQQAAVVVRVGTRHVKPRYGMRAWSTYDDPRDGDAMLAAGAHANRMWLQVPSAAETAATKKHIARLRAQGVTPVIAIGVDGMLSKSNLAMWTKVAVTSLLRWQKASAVRHFALVFDATASSVRMEGKRAQANERGIVQATVDALRPGGLEELVVVPRCHSDRLAKVAGAPPDLSAFPEVVMAWSGPSEHASGVTRAQAERRVKEAGTPIVLLETWPLGRSGDVRIPTLPHGRAKDLHDVLDGIVVLGRDAAEDILESAWKPLEHSRFGMSELTPLVPARALGPRAFLTTLSANLRKADKEGLGLVPWMAPFARELDGAARRLASYGGVATMRGRDLEGAILLAAGAAKAGVTVISNEHELRFFVRIPHAAVPKGAAWLLRLHVEARGRTDRWEVELTDKGARFDRSPRDEAPNIEPGHVRCQLFPGKSEIRAEISFDRFALGGEPHAGRIFEVAAFWGPTRIWPPKGPDGAVGLLVITR